MAILWLRMGTVPGGAKITGAKRGREDQARREQVGPEVSFSRRRIEVTEIHPDLRKPSPDDTSGKNFRQERDRIHPLE
jgi:hypothetical protein